MTTPVRRATTDQPTPRTKPSSWTRYHRPTAKTRFGTTATTISTGHPPGIRYGRCTPGWRYRSITSATNSSSNAASVSTTSITIRLSNPPQAKMLQITHDRTIDAHGVCHLGWMRANERGRYPSSARANGSRLYDSNHDENSDTADTNATAATIHPSHAPPMRSAKSVNAPSSHGISVVPTRARITTTGTR